MNPIGLYTFIRQEVSRFLRVGQQTLFTPWITALLYILIFGEIVGRRIGIIIVTGFLIGGIMRALAVGAGVYVLALFFTAASMTHLLLFLFYSVSVSIIFSLAGLLVWNYFDFVFNFWSGSLGLAFVQKGV